LCCATRSNGRRSAPEPFGQSTIRLLLSSTARAPASPHYPTAASYSWRSLRSARVPPVRYRDKPEPTPERGHDWMPIQGQTSAPIDIFAALWRFGGGSSAWGDAMAKPRDDRRKDLLRPALEDIIDLGVALSSPNCAGSGSRQLGDLEGWPRAERHIPCILFNRDVVMILSSTGR